MLIKLKRQCKLEGGKLLPFLDTHVEPILLLWVGESNERNIPLTRSAICDKAKGLFDDIKEKEGGDDTFRASRSWFTNFKQRTQIYNMELTSEAVN
jgi:hypothetical protein